MNTIAFKITALPFRPPRQPSVLASAIAFATMLNDCTTAALHGNLYDPVQLPVNVAPLPTGYLTVACVTHLADGLATIENLMARFSLTGDCEIAFKTLLQQTYQYHSGLRFGDFEANFAESDQWRKTLKDAGPSFWLPQAQTPVSP